VQPAIFPPLKNFHHVAFRFRDAQETRAFYEGILGMPMTAALALDEISGTNTKLEYLHLFFQMSDGNYLAFFDAPDTATEEHFKKKSGFNRHLAIETESLGALETFKEKLKAHGIEFWGPLDHGFVKSIYFYDPNGINVEITARTAQYEEILADEKRKLESEMSKWIEKTRAKKAGRNLKIAA